MGGLLTDYESVRQYLQEQHQDAAQEDDIDTLILQASEAIPRFCDREFGPTDGATRSFEFTPEYDCPTTVVNTLIYELRVVTGVRLDPDMAGGVALAASEYRLWPYPANREGTFYGVRLASTIPRPTQDLTFPTRRVDITGNWGTAEVPELIRRYANETVAAWLELPKDGRDFNEAPIEGDAPAHGDDIPPSVRKGLTKNFKRPIFP